MNLMKRMTLATLAASGLAGCAVTPLSEDTASMKQAFDSRIVQCALPVLGGGNPSVRIGYRYANGSVDFEYEPAAPAWREDFEYCAAPLGGPRAQFSGEVQVWTKP